MESLALAALFGSFVTWIALKRPASPSPEQLSSADKAAQTKNDLDIQEERKLCANEEKLSELIKLSFAIRRLRVEFSEELTPSQDKELSKAEETSLSRTMDAATFYLYIAKRNRIHFTDP